MCVFYNGWKIIFSPVKSENNDVESIKTSTISADNTENIIIGQLSTDQFDNITLNAFLSVPFSHHYEILQRSETKNG